MSELNIELSQAQLNYIQSDSEITLASGAIRSGKTYVQIWTLFNFLQSDECLENYDILFVGKTGDSLERNIIKDFMDLCHKLGRGHYFRYIKAPAKKIVYEPKNINIHFVGGNDEGSESKVRGMTIQALFGDEVTLMPKLFIEQCFGRMSAGCQKTWFTTNPDSPAHWLFQDYMNNPEIDINVLYFTFTDNPSLTEKYKKRITSIMKRSQASYDRFILGKWVADLDLMVIPEFLNNIKDLVREHERPKYCHKVVSMDVGFEDFTFVVFGYYDFKEALFVIEDEICEKQTLTHELAKLIRQKEKDLWGVEYIGDYKYKDGIEPFLRVSDIDKMLVADLSRQYELSFSETKKQGAEANRNKLRDLCHTHRFIVNPRCVNLISHLKTGVWNTNKTSYARTEDQGHFDGIDAALYFIRNCPEHSNPYPSEYYTEDNRYVSQELLDNTKSDEYNILKEALGI